MLLGPVDVFMFNESINFSTSAGAIGNLLFYLRTNISTDKANLFARNFSCNSTFDDGSQQLPDFPSRTEQRLGFKHITTKMVSHAIYDLDASKATGPTEFKPLCFLRCVLQSFLLNAWTNLVFLPVGNLHHLCHF